MKHKIKSALQSGNIDELYGALIRAGKTGEIELEDIVLKLTSHESPIIRGAAIKVLVYFWQMEKYKELAWKMYLEEDDDDARATILHAYFTLFSNSNRKDMMLMAYDILKDKDEDEIVRDTALDCIFTVSPVASRDWPDAPDYDNFDEGVDWEFVEKLIAEAE